VSTQSNAAVKLGEEQLHRRERRPVSMRGFILRGDGSQAEVLLLDLSYEGCGIETPVQLGIGEGLKLSVMGRGGIDAHVRWYREGRAGLIFDAEEQAEKEHWPRAFDRIKLTAEVSIRRLGKLNYRVSVYDISPTGCKVELVDRPRLDEHVLVKFNGLEALESEVCWVEGTCAGLCFEKPIHPAVFDLLLTRLT
jgi:hypothetical protein